LNGRKRLLIVDDEPDFAKFVAKVSSDLGYETVTTNAAETFQAAYLAAPPDVIVLDMVMPKMDGIETVRWLVDKGCRARIIIISGYNPVFGNAAQSIGEIKGRLEISQLQKPIRLSELRAVLGEILAD